MLLFSFLFFFFLYFFFLFLLLFRKLDKFLDKSTKRSFHHRDRYSIVVLLLDIIAIILSFLYTKKERSGAL